jgi:hypothetical protein
VRIVTSASQASAVKTVTSDCRRHHRRLGLYQRGGLGMRNMQTVRAAWLQDSGGHGARENVAGSKTYLAVSHELLKKHTAGLAVVGS